MFSETYLWFLNFRFLAHNGRSKKSINWKWSKVLLKCTVYFTGRQKPHTKMQIYLLYRLVGPPNIGNNFSLIHQTIEATKHAWNWGYWKLYSRRGGNQKGRVVTNNTFLMDLISRVFETEWEDSNFMFREVVLRTFDLFLPRFSSLVSRYMFDQV